ncbi:MAG TPA: septal ring lytic transglycosylase RlpA family protein [Candidatus Saccharimonadales bacterium]|nr:septal ring lytic transglycosylase RlpA family protein [Candidatus Saccharimonadales bacterium]
MKTKIKPKAKSKPTKRALIKELRAKAARRAGHNARRSKKLAHQNLAIVMFTAIITISFGGVAFAINLQLIPPPTAFSKYPDTQAVLDNYIKHPKITPDGYPDQIGKASWYAIGLPAPDALTCASTTFPRGTHLKVKNLRNGREVVCLVNDYGPQAWTGKVIDLSRGSFVQIDSLNAGTAPVEIRVQK